MLTELKFMARIKETLAIEEFLSVRLKPKRKMTNSPSSPAKRESETPSPKTTTASRRVRRRMTHSPSLEDLKEDREAAWEEGDLNEHFKPILTNDCVS